MTCRFGLTERACGKLYEFDVNCQMLPGDAENLCEICTHNHQLPIDTPIWLELRRLMDEGILNYNDLGSLVRIARIGARIQQHTEDKDNGDDS